MVFCYVPFCSMCSKRGGNIDENGCKVSFHEIPVDYEQKLKWIKAIRRRGETSLNYHQPSERSVVCSLHFRNDDYVPGLKVNRLKPGAVPSVFVNYPGYKPIKQRKKRQKIKSTPESLDSVNNVNNLLSPSENSNVDGLALPTNVAEMELEPLVNSVTTQTQWVLKRTKSIETNLKMFHLNKWEKKYDETKVELYNLKKQASSLKSINHALKCENQELKEMIEESNGVKLRHNPEAAFVMDQLKVFDKAKPRWSEATMKFAILLHDKSPAVYEYVQQLGFLKLPTRSTLKRYIDNESGEAVSSQMLKRLRIESKNLEKDLERLESSIDTSIGSSLEDDQHGDEETEDIFSPIEEEINCDIDAHNL